MKKTDILPTDDTARIDDILQTSWRILKTRFIKRRYEISSEAPFQHYFAHIISTIGDTYCITRTEKFMVDLEVKLEGKNNNDEVKKSYIDITCGFSRGGNDSREKTAIELKFKTKSQGAPNDTRNLVFQDIKRLENARKEDSFSQGRFYMITDLQTYANKSKKGLGTVFRTHDGAETQANEEIYYPDSTSKKNVKVTLDDPYSFNWEKIDKKTTKKEEWYFLEIPVLKTRTN
jgi:hypothetical protein